MDGFGEGADSLTSNFGTAKANNADAVIAKHNPSLTLSEREVQAYNEMKDAEWHKKFENPASFKQHLFNEAGPTVGAMEVYVVMLAKRIAIVEGADTDQV